MRRRMRLVIGVLLLALGLGGLLHVTRSAVAPLANPGRADAQVRFLARALDRGAGPQMQAYFPEGEFFTWVLTGLAAGRLAEQGVQPQENLAVVLAAVANSGRPEVADRFGAGHRGVPHGAFYHGWRLLLLVQQAKVTGDAGQLDQLSAEASQLLAALDAPGEPPLTSYPNAAWPCDLVVAMAAVHQADVLRPVPGLAAATERYLAGLDDWRDPATGLIGHVFGLDGSVSGARGSSQAIINSYLRDISPGHADAEWARYTELFVQPSFGLVGLREYPVGSSGGGDVDSGPLIGGVSLSASAVSLGAALRNGDLALANRLNRQAELLGVPLPWRGDAGLNGRAFAFGIMPVGDAFVADARTQPSGVTTASVRPDHPGIWWPLWFLVAALPALLGALLLRHSHSRERT